MHDYKLLIAASTSIPEKIIRKYLTDITSTEINEIFYSDNNKHLENLVKSFKNNANGISLKSNISNKKIISQVSHLILLWDGQDLNNILFEARLQKKKIKLIPIELTKVVNKQTTDEFDVYIGRGTPWGNPFAIAHGEGPDRFEVIEKYREYFYKKINEDSSFHKGILSMKGLRLACFCKPAACHGDVIAEYLDNLPTESI